MIGVKFHQAGGDVVPFHVHTVGRVSFCDLGNNAVFENEAAGNNPIFKYQPGIGQYGLGGHSGSLSMLAERSRARL